MQKFQCLLFGLKRSYICYYLTFMTVPLIIDYQKRNNQSKCAGLSEHIIKQNTDFQKPLD